MTTQTTPLPPRAVATFDAVAVSPHHLSTSAALSVIEAGGTAVDAAIAANAVQGVVAPETCGIGGDLFALVARPGESTPWALNSSGRAGAGADAEALRRAGLDSIPQRHAAAVTVPGCVDGWLALHDEMGSLELSTILQPAVRIARAGFPASTELAAAFGLRASELVDEPSAEDMYPSGRLPSAGDLITRRKLADTLEAVAMAGRSAFYGGPVGEAICAATGGMITPDDMDRNQAEWVEPLSVVAFGHTAWTVPPNSQGYIALVAMAVMDRVGITDLDDPATWHVAIEASRLAAADRDHVLSDPATMEMAADELIAAERVETLADRVGPRRSVAAPSSDAVGGTAYLCVVDGSGLGVSLIQSNFHGIGSGRSVEAGGFLLHDRGRGFDLRPGHPNELGPGRRPLHTLIPTLWTRDGHLAGVLGTRGGHIQPQLVAQLASGTFRHDLDPGVAMVRPRWSLDPSDPSSPVAVEPGVPKSTIADLESRGHALVELDAPQRGWGPMSVALVGGDGLRRAAADPRVDTATAAAR